MKRFIEAWKARRRQREAYRRYGCDLRCDCGGWMHSEGSPVVLNVSPGVYDYICDRCSTTTRWDFMIAPAPIKIPVTP